jgi:small subunit ribosomal protein S6
MAAPAPTYDLMLMLDPKAPEADRSKVRSEAKALIEREGSVVADHDYGDRALAYEINHEKRAEYELIQFQCPPATLDQLSNMLRIADAVTRFRIIKDLPGTPAPPDLRQAAPPPESPAESGTTAQDVAPAEQAAEAPVAEDAVAVPEVEAQAPAETEVEVVAESEVPAEAEAPGEAAGDPEAAE